MEHKPIQRELARRIYTRYKPVFKKGSKYVRVESTTVPRTLVSMTCFVSELSRLQKDLAFTIDTPSALVFAGAIPALSAVVFGIMLLSIPLYTKVQAALDRLLGRDSLGGGDIKLFAVVGLYLGFVGTLFAVVIACVVGLALHALSGRRVGGREFPFGPSIALAAALMLLYGEPLVAWYASLLA